MASKNKCLNCGEEFGWPEFSSYMLKLRSKTVFCVVCQTDNFFVPKYSFSYFFFFILSLLIAVTVFFGVNVLYAFARYNEYRGTVRISPLALFLGGAMSLASARIMMNIFTWKHSGLSMDKIYKSASDYE